MAKAPLRKSARVESGDNTHGKSVRGGVVVSYAEKPCRSTRGIRESEDIVVKDRRSQIFAAQ